MKTNYWLALMLILALATGVLSAGDEWDISKMPVFTGDITKHLDDVVIDGDGYFVIEIGGEMYVYFEE